MVFKSNTFVRFTYRTPIQWFYTPCIKKNGVNHWSVFLIDKTQWDRCSVYLTKLLLYTQTIFNFETNLKRFFQVFDRNIKFWTNRLWSKSDVVFISDSFVRFPICLFYLEDGLVFTKVFFVGWNYNILNK